MRAIHQDSAEPMLPFEQDKASLSAHGEQAFAILFAQVPDGHMDASTH